MVDSGGATAGGDQRGHRDGPARHPRAGRAAPAGGGRSAPSRVEGSGWLCRGRGGRDPRRPRRRPAARTRRVPGAARQPRTASRSSGRPATVTRPWRSSRERRPDVVLMDIRMPALDGLEATRAITADPGLAGVKVLILTTFELDEYVFEALRAGAAGFLVKHTEPAELVRAVRVVAAGEALLSPSVTRRLIAEFTSRPSRGEASGQRAGRPHRPGAGGRRPGRPGPVERRDRRRVGRQPGHGADPRQPGDEQAARPRPGPARRDGLPERPRPDHLTVVQADGFRGQVWP